MNIRLKEHGNVSKILESKNLPVYYLEGATHHVYLKNPEGLVELIEEEINSSRDDTSTQLSLS
jgi:arginine deiminase